MTKEWQPAEGQFPPTPSDDHAVAQAQANRNRHNLDVIVPMVRYRQERIQSLGRRVAIEVVFCVLDEEIRRIQSLTAPRYRGRRKK